VSRPKKCKICTGDLVITGQVNSLLEAGVKLKTIAEQVPGFSVFQLSRHKNNCLAPKAASELPPESGSAEITKWLQRAEDTYLTAQVNGDVKSAASAISTAVRTLTALEKQIQAEKTEADAGVDNPNRPMNIADFDKLVHDFELSLESDKAGGFCMRCRQPLPLKITEKTSAND